jgi:uncharacterized protein YciI
MSVMKHTRRAALAALLSGASAFAQAPPAQQFLLRIEPVRAGFSLENMTEDERRLASGHIAYLRGLFTDGKLTFSGQAMDPKGLFGVTVVNAAGQEEAAALLNGDPAVKGKMFRGEVIPFRTVLERGAQPR